MVTSGPTLQSLAQSSLQEDHREDELFGSACALPLLSPAGSSWPRRPGSAAQLVCWKAWGAPAGVARRGAPRSSSFRARRARLARFIVTALKVVCVEGGCLAGALRRRLARDSSPARCYGFEATGGPPSQCGSMRAPLGQRLLGLSGRLS